MPGYWLRLLRAHLHAARPIVQLDMFQTLRRIVDDNVALARFGDGELKLAFYRRGLRFQRHSKELASELNRVLLVPREHLLVGFNTVFARTANWQWIARYQRYGKAGEAPGACIPRTTS